MKTRYLLLILSLMFCLFSYSQPNNPTNPVPLDGGLSLLVLAGTSYAAYLLKQKRSDEEKTTEE